MKKVLVTGSTGYIGHWISHVLNKDYNVIGLSRRKEKTDFKLINCDLLKNLPIIDFDILIHVAAMTDITECEEKPKQAKKVNVDGTKKLLEMAKENNVDRIVYISTGTVYAPTIDPINEDFKINPVNIYGKTKYQAEKIVQSYSSNFPATTLRLFFPYGPNTHPNKLISRLIKMVNMGEAILLNQGNRPLFNPIYITDLIDLVKLVLESSNPGYEVFNAGGGETVDIKQLGEIIGKVLEKKVTFEESDKDSSNYIALIEKARKKLGFKPVIKIEEGIRRSINGIF